MPEQDRSHWVTHEQLDTPLRDIFPDTRTSGTARQYVRYSCFVLGQQPKDLSKLSYEELNEYMDNLDASVARYLEQST